MTTSPTTTTTTTVPTTATNTSRAIPSEVGWQFVPQYYTFVNKQPNRLHCFYTKASTFIHGTEGEDGKPCFGQLEIHNKITSIGFQDCKVFIHSVDAQASADDGIIIQVIGEMSNHGDPWRKFVQTFFLAKQPNGYFVLNDIFRFLKEDTTDSDDGETEAEVAAPPSISEPAPAYSPAATEAVKISTREPSPVPPTVPPAPSVVVPSPAAEEAPTVDVSEPSTIIQTPTPAPEPVTPISQPNGIYTSETETVATNPLPEKSPAPVSAPLPASSSSVISVSPGTSDAIPPTTLSVPPLTTAPSQGQVPPEPSSSPAPPGHRSWATLAATNPKKWGAAVALDSRGVTETPVGANSGGNRTPPGPAPSNRGPQHHHHHSQGGVAAAQKISIPSVFVKGVTDPISEAQLTNTLTHRFGPIKDLEIVRGKACAFLDFLNIDAAKRAIIASLPVAQGGEGGIWIDGTRISVETKKERGDRPMSRSRGGGPPSSPVNGGDGSGRGGGFSRGGGRGGAGGRGRGMHGGTK